MHENDGLAPVKLLKRPAGGQGVLAICRRNLSPTQSHKKYIVSDPEILRGKPRLKGTRIPVGLVLGYLAAGKTSQDIMAEFPEITREHIAAWDYARELAEFEAVV